MLAHLVFVKAVSISVVHDVEPMSGPALPVDRRIEQAIDQIRECVSGIVLQEDLGNESLQKTLRNADERQKLLLLKEAIGHILTIQEKL